MGRAARACALALAIAGLLAGCRGAGPRTDAGAEASVRPGINEPYENVSAVGEWVERFEREGREVYDRRESIVAAMGLPPDAVVADVGAGTGLFTLLLAERVPGGRVIALDIVPAFVEHIAAQARAAQRTNVSVQACSDRSVMLPPDSIDAAFICDTYHHFEYPRSTMRSLHEALRPGGEVFVLDFQRIEGRSSDWVLSHVRAGRERVIEEIESFGFEWVEDLTDVVGLEENYMLRFRKRADAANSRWSGES